jgi:hypothetical protein
MNINEFSEGVRGAQQGLMLGQDPRVDELNERLQSRHFPDRPLQPNFDPRSTPTKYARFPMIERRALVSESIQPGTPFDIHTNFNPATNRGPVGAYLANIDTDTVLRGYYNSLQHGADQSVYIPHSSSNMYLGIQAVGRQEIQTHTDLFSRNRDFQTTVSDVATKTGHQPFSNYTRIQLRDI